MYISGSMNNSKSYLLQQLRGCVLAFSFYQLHPNASLCMRLRRISDDALLDVGFRNGYIDMASIHAFLGGGNAGCAIWYNQAQNVSGNNALQTDSSKQPLFDYTSNYHKGLSFDGTAKYMSVAPYTAIDIRANPLNFYASYYNFASSGRYIFCLNTSTSGDRQYGMYGDTYNATSVKAYTFLNGAGFTATATLTAKEPFSNLAWRWGANGLMVNETKLETNTNQSYNSAISQVGTVLVIGARGNTGVTATGFLNGQLKTLLIFNSYQSGSFYDQIKKAGV